MQSVIEYIERGSEQRIADLTSFLKIPSISNSTVHQADMLHCAQFLAGRLKQAGMQVVEIIETAGHPLIFAEYISDKAKPTVLIYGHYDVQPVDPVDLWTSLPFEPQVRDGKLYGRGTVDDKGQIYVHLHAVEAYLRANGSLPVNVKFIIEGEEEIGSINIEPFLRANAGKLAADCIIISDTSMYGHNMPSICYGLRGICYVELDVRSADADLHSGSFGGVVPNALNALTEIIAALKDGSGRISIPGFYDDVVTISLQERDLISRLPFDADELRKTAGVSQLAGETGYTPLERMWARPTLDCNGIWGGYFGEGAKTIIPAWGKAKLSMRLVPNQDASKITRQLDEYLKEITPLGVTASLSQLHGCNGFLMPLDHPAVKAAARALSRAFGAEVCYIREGGSIGIVTTMQEAFGKPILLIGFGHPGENSHAPDEHIYLDHFHTGTMSMAYLYEELACLNG